MSRGRYSSLRLYPCTKYIIQLYRLHSEGVLLELSSEVPLGVRTEGNPSSERKPRRAKAHDLLICDHLAQSIQMFSAVRRIGILVETPKRMLDACKESQKSEQKSHVLRTTCAEFSRRGDHSSTGGQHCQARSWPRPKSESSDGPLFTA